MVQLSPSVELDLSCTTYSIIPEAQRRTGRTVSEESGTKVASYPWAMGERGFLHTSWDCHITKTSFWRCFKAALCGFPRPLIRAYLKDHGPWLPRSQYPTDICLPIQLRVQQSRSPIVWKQTHQNSGRQSRPSKSYINNSITCCIDLYCFHQFSISSL